MTTRNRLQAAPAESPAALIQIFTNWLIKYDSYLVQGIGEVGHGNILENKVKLSIAINGIDIIEFVNFFVHLDVSHILEIDWSHFNFVVEQGCT